MAGLCWMAVVLAFSTSIGNSLAVDLTWVTNHAYILNYYFMKNMQFSLAVNIPVDQNKLKNAFDKDASADVQNKVLQGGMYRGTNVVAATFQKNTAPAENSYTDHAEARVLDNIDPLASSSKGNILVLYSFLSPCGQKCTSSDPKHRNTNILDKINKAFQNSNWADRAFVFTKVFDGYGNIRLSVDDIKETFNKLAGTPIGHNIFRCYYPKKGPCHCIKCFNNEVLSDNCVNN